MPVPPLLTRSSNKAAALIIVLAFVVLLTGLALAYFTGTTIDRQLAHTSSNDTSADLLARSALDVVVGDFKQEIVNGSASTSVSGTTIYVPNNATNMVPQQSGNVAGVPNLIRRSVRLDPLSGNPGVPSRASAVNSQDDSSANGRKISSTRWNSHYLVPKGTATTADSSPIPAFTLATPDWVFVKGYDAATQQGGPAVITAPDALVIGRYAYAVYDEGGLLDMNTVGYPTPAPSPIAEYLTDIGRKGVPAWVDVTAIIPTPTPSGTPFMKELVGFRNYATLLQNNISNLAFSFGVTNAGIDSFINYVLSGGIGQPHRGTSTDYGSVNPISAADGRTDQKFVTRAELINFLKSLGNTAGGISVNALQYMGTFSREQNKPSLPLTQAWPFTRVVLPQRFYLGNLNLAIYPSPTPTPVVTPTPTATPTLTPTLRTSLGLQFASAVTPPPATPTPTPTPGPCDLQVRWKYVGNQDPANNTPLSAIPAFPSDLTTLDFFQYINYALFGTGVTAADSANIPFTLGIGAALIDAYDADGAGSNANALITGIYYGSSAATCDPTIAACLVYGAEQATNSPLFSVWWVPPTQGGGCMPSVPVAPQAFGPATGSFVPSINSPTRSVGEFGWAYSVLNAANNRNIDAPPKYVIDFKDAYNSANNPDPALLDFFTYNNAPVRSGIVNLNTRQAPVLAAILKGALYQGFSNVLSNQNPTYQALNAANSIVTATTAQPAQSRADISRFASVVNSSPFSVTANQDIKDTFARAFSELTQTRTWGLLIDIVAQTGHYKPNATNLQTDFVVEGEKRYWLHIAIDRFDGTIVGQQLEEVTE